MNDHILMAIKNLKSKKVAPDLHEKDTGIGKIGHKPESGKDPHLDADQDMDHDDGVNDKAPAVDDGGLNHLMAQDGEVPHHGIPAQVKGDPNDEGKDGDPLSDEFGRLKAMTDGSPMGRASMTLGERAKDKMKERMAAIQKIKGAKS